jgi:outer membrane protein OmpA-like peptidoglycan-associated protein
MLFALFQQIGFCDDTRTHFRTRQTNHPLMAGRADVSSLDANSSQWWIQNQRSRPFAVLWKWLCPFIRYPRRKVTAGWPTMAGFETTTRRNDNQTRSHHMKKIALFALVICVSFAGMGWAAETQTQTQTLEIQGPAATGKITYQQIEPGKVLVSVVDAEENPIMGLTAKDFTIRENQKTAKILQVEPLATSKDVGLNMVLVVDNSKSMKDRKAVDPLLNALEAVYEIIRPIDEVTAIVYDDDKTIKLNGHNLHAKILKSNNPTYLRAFFKEQLSQGLTEGTYLYDAMMVGLDQARQWSEKSNKFMVVFTDGEDLNSSVNQKQLEAEARKMANIGIFSVDYMPEQSTNTFLQAMANQYSGKAWKASSSEELIPIFKDFSSTLLHRYVVSYRLLNPPSGALAFAPAQLTIQEVTTIDSAPLLNYVFFETITSELSDRYTLFENQARTDEFSEKALAGVMEKYSNLLNIVGKRLRDNPDATITLVGCNSNTGPEAGREDLSTSRAKSVQAYLRYVWGIAPERMAIESRNLPEAPSTNRIPEGQAENQRVEIRSDHPAILDTVKSEYVEKISDTPELKLIPNIAAEAGIASWQITLKAGETVIGTFSGEGAPAQALSLPLTKDHLDAIATAGNIRAALAVKDTEANDLVTDKAGELPVRFIRRKEQMAQKQGYKVREQYALILFDYDSAAIKARNKQVVDRIIGRIKVVPQAAVNIIGHTDNIGKEAYNVQLSEKRALSVRDQFMQANAPVAYNMRVEGAGPHNPLYDNAVPEGRSLNRTVTIALEYEQQQ